MLSRVADSIYWMSRYLERAENAARFIDTQLQMMLDLPPMRKDPKAWEALVHITGDEAYFQEKYGQPNQENVMFFHTFDANYPNSIVSCLQAARENARSVREIIPSEMWEHINRLHLKLTTIKVGKAVFQNPHQFYNNIKLSSHLILGIFYATMSQNEAWQFGAMGRLLERADKTSRILDVKYFLLLPGVDFVGSSWDTVQWTALLKSTSASEMYRKRFNLIDPKHIVEFLLLDREFPRSILFCLLRAQDALFKIMGHAGDRVDTELERRFGKLTARLTYANVGEVVGSGLHEFLDRFQEDLNRLSDAIFDAFFAIKPPAAHQFSRLGKS